MSTSPTLVERNSSYAQSHKALPMASELSQLPSTIIVTCADPRVFPEKFLKLAIGEAILFRNFGGRITQQVLREILVTDTYMGNGMKDLIIIHHTDCGGLHMKSEDVKQKLITRYPEDKSIAEWETGAFDHLSLAESVTDDIQKVKTDTMISEVLKANTVGYVYDITTGLLSEVS